MISRTAWEGIEETIRTLSKEDFPYAITGSYAAAQLATVAPPVAINIYDKDIRSARDTLALRPSERVGNVRLIQSFSQVEFERTLECRGMALASPSQVAADLLTLPKRSQEEYDALIHWMRQHEKEWRVA